MIICLDKGRFLFVVAVLLEKNGGRYGYLVLY
jgi:hypothetical protein